MATPFLSSPVLIMRSGLLGVSAGGSSLGRTRAPAGRTWWIGPIVADARSASGSDDDDLARELRQSLDSASCDVEADEVLDPDARLAVQVDAGLDREDRRARQGRVGGRPTERWVLVRRETDAVARAVAEMVAMPTLGDDGAGERVHRRATRGLRALGDRRLECLDHG